MKVVILGAWYILLTLHVQCDEQNSSKKPAVPRNEWCPVLTDEPIESKFTISYQGETVGLCCNKCKRKFLKNPEKYLKNLPQFNKTNASGNIAPESSAKDGATKTKERTNRSSDDEAISLSIRNKSAQTDYPKKRHLNRTHSLETVASWRDVVAYVGKFHPLMVHFPIALTITAALSEAAFMRIKNELLSNVATFNLTIAGLTAIVAAILGWANGAFIRVDTGLEPVLFWHRWLGILSTVCLIFAIFFSESARRLDNTRLNAGYRACLFIATALVAVTGHFGGTLVFGSDHFDW